MVNAANGSRTRSPDTGSVRPEFRRRSSSVSLVRESNTPSGSAASWLFCSSRLVRLVRSANTSAGSAASWLFCSSRLVRLVRSANTSAGGAVRSLAPSLRWVRLVRPSNTSAGNAVSWLLCRFTTIRLLSGSNTSSGVVSVLPIRVRAVRAVRPVSPAKSPDARTEMLWLGRARDVISASSLVNTVEQGSLSVGVAARMAVCTWLVREQMFTVSGWVYGSPL